MVVLLLLLLDPTSQMSGCGRSENGKEDDLAVPDISHMLKTVTRLTGWQLNFWERGR